MLAIAGRVTRKFDIVWREVFKRRSLDRTRIERAAKQLSDGDFHEGANLACIALVVGT